MIAGCWLGWPSPANQRLLHNETSIVVNQEQISWIVSLLDLGNVVSPIPAGIIMDVFGRKSILVFSAFLYMATWILTYLAESPTLLYVARFGAGLGKGISFTVVPMYVGEIASVNIRGALSTMFTGLLWAGTMFEFALGPYVSFRTMAILSGIIPIVFFFSYIWMPDSPYYLLMRGRDDEALKSLKWLRNSDGQSTSEDPKAYCAENELKEMKEMILEEMKNKGKFTDLIASPGNRRATLIVLVESAFQRLCGISSLLAYSSITLPNVTYWFIGPSEVVFLFGAILTLSNYIATPLVDSWGRRPLLLFSGGGCCVFTGISAVFYYFHYNTSVDLTSFYWVPYLCLCLFGVTHSVGIGVLPSTLASELFPANVKSIASAASTIMFAVSSFLVNKLYATVTLHFGVFAMFAFFSLSGLLCALFTYFFVFETKGKSFAEIQHYLHSVK